MTTYRIPFNKPTLAGSELNYIADAVLKGHSAGAWRLRSLRSTSSTCSLVLRGCAWSRDPSRLLGS